MQNSDAVRQYIMHHVTDSHEWALPFLKVQLPPWLSLHALMVLLGAGFLLLLFGVFYRRHDAVPRGLTNVLEMFVSFIHKQVSIPCLGKEDARRMTPLFCGFFFFILILNFMGLIPLFATATANIGVTGPLAIITLGFMIFGSIYRHGVLGFLKLFTPHGVPWPILILVAPLEFISMFVKAFALTVRLFANMLAGHIVIFALLGLVVMMGWMALPAVLMAALIYILEIFIAFLQAFIFTLLSAMFIGQMYHPQH